MRSLLRGLLLAPGVLSTSAARTAHERDGAPATALSVVDDVRPSGGAALRFGPTDASELRQGEPMELCDCEDADLRSHGGLQCTKEGQFIASFEAVGHWVRAAGPLRRRDRAAVRQNAGLWKIARGKQIGGEEQVPQLPRGTAACGRRSTAVARCR